VTGIEERTPAPVALQLLPNSPNPFSGSTQLRIGLPADGDVEIHVYDIAGRRVYSRRVSGVPAGWWSTPFDGRDGGGRLLPSGVYFYRVSAEGVSATRKMVITR
jgi:hypothetical protein